MEIKNLKKRKEVKQTESPIESKLLYWFNQYQLYPEIQHEIGKYRADFFFPDLKLVVEADGKEYHTSPEQVESDKERDGYMENLGYKILRFSGGKIYNEPWNVVKKVLEVYYPPKEITGFERDIYSGRLVTKYNDDTDFEQKKNDAWNLALKLAEEE